MKNKKIIIAGGSGFIGQGLLEFFGKENQMVLLSRKRRIGIDQVRYVQWNGRDPEPGWVGELDGADLVINLAGKSVDCRYHKKQRREIIDSRVNATKALGNAIRQCAHPPALWINAASATIYANSLLKPNDEFSGTISELKKDNMPANLIDTIRRKVKKIKAEIMRNHSTPAWMDPDLDFSVQVCKKWEQAFFAEETPGTRKIALRVAITLGNGGVLKPFLRMCKLRMGGRQGKGTQMFSWVHIEDLARMIDWLTGYESPAKLYNCAAPGAVSNAEFMKALRRASGQTWGFPSPAFLLEFGAFLISTETELLLKSRWVTPERATREGFKFKYPYLDEALRHIVPNIR